MFKAEELVSGFPDNIRLSTQGTFYVGLGNYIQTFEFWLRPFMCLASPRYRGKLSLFDQLGPHPWARKLLASVLPDKYLGLVFGLFKSSYGLVVELDTNGKIIGSYHDPDGSVVPDVSQVNFLFDEINRLLYFYRFPTTNTIYIWAASIATLLHKSRRRNNLDCDINC